MTNEPVLFLELQELILEFLAADLPIFLKCRLVCKCWDHCCRPRVFKSVDLSSRPEKKRRKRFIEFSKLLAAPGSPAFAPDIQHITLNEEPRAEDIQALPTEILKNLHSLCVKSDFALGPGYFRAVSKKFSRIVQLDIVNIPFMIRRTLLDFICSFERLEGLAFGDPRWLGFWVDAHHAVDFGRWKLPPIKSLSLSLDLGATVERTFLGWLLGQLQERKTLQILQYRARFGCADTNKPLLTAVSTSLKVLSFDSEFSTTLNVLKAPECRFLRLTTLHLGIAIDEAHISRFGNFRFGDFSTKVMPRAFLNLTCIANISCALSEVEAPELRHLTLKFFTQPDSSDSGQLLCSLNILQYVQFEKLDKLFSSSPNPFHSLHVVTILCGPDPTLPCVEYLSVAVKNDLPIYITPPKPGDGASFQAQASAFLISNFPLTLAQNSVQVQVRQA